MTNDVINIDESLIQRWKEKVCDKPGDVDPDQERDWFDLAYGFFLGCNLDPERAYEHAIEAWNRGML